MNDILKKLIKGEIITDEDIDQALHDNCNDNCNDVHPTCDEGCLVFETNGGILNPHADRNCECFKNGKRMRLYLKGFL